MYHAVSFSQGNLSYLRRMCVVEEATGDLVCKKCKCMVYIDWFMNEIECQGCDEI